MHLAERKGVLVTIREEDAVRGSLPEIWNLGKTDRRNQAPVLLRSSMVSCFALPFLAIGLADGTVLLYGHLDQSLSPAVSLTALPRTIRESSPEPIADL
ncbi:uncharacterized protein BJ212DRAFT_1381591, partial [Suillus subaureus]